MVTSPRLATNSYPKDRDAIIEIFKKHGYTQFSSDQSVVRVDGKGRFGEYVAVHPEKGSYTLNVRRGGAEYLLEVAEDLGGSLDGPVLAFRSLDLVGVDQMLGRLVASLKNRPV